MLNYELLSPDTLVGLLARKEGRTEVIDTIIDLARHDDNAGVRDAATTASKALGQALD